MSKIFIGGDFYASNRVSNLISSGRGESIFEDFKEIFDNCDYKIINLEAPVTNSNRPLFKKGKNMKMDFNTLDFLKDSNFNLLTLANNHFYDFGQHGIKDTIKYCSKLQIETVGGGMNLLESQKIKYIQLRKIKIGIINFCEDEFSVATENHGGSNKKDIVENCKSVIEAKRNADHVIVISHGGHEHYQLPSPNMVNFFRFLIDCGASAVINHHQHCFSGYEIYKTFPIFYGLGNFCFDKGLHKLSSWHEGFSVLFDFKDKINFEIIPHIQFRNKSKVEILSDKTYFNAKIKKLNSIIKDPNLLNTEYNKYKKQKSKTSLAIFQPYNNKYLIAAFKRGYIPDFNSKRFYAHLKLFISCDSHREILLHSLKNKIKQSKK